MIKFEYYTLCVCLVMIKPSVAKHDLLSKNDLDENLPFAFLLNVVVKVSVQEGL